MKIGLEYDELKEIREAVPQLDLLALRALKRAGFDVVRSQSTPQPMPTLALQQLPDQESYSET